MNISQYNMIQLTLNAKAQGRELNLRLIKSLDSDRGPWLSDVVIKASLLGSHDTVRTQWISVDDETLLRVTGEKLREANSSSNKKGMTSSSSSKTGGDEGLSPEQLNPPSVKKTKASSSMSGKTGGEAEKSEETIKEIEIKTDPGTMSSDQKLQLSEQYAQQLDMLKAAKSKAHSTSVKAEHGEGE
jgi:hypothetical protein